MVGPLVGVVDGRKERAVGSFVGGGEGYGVRPGDGLSVGKTLGYLVGNCEGKGVGLKVRHVGLGVVLSFVGNDVGLGVGLAVG